MESETTGQAFIIMGVSGCGKSTIGEALAAHLHCPYYDGDDFHPAQNIAKMANGIPLDDDDREPWLAILAGLLREHLQKGETAVLACSALKKSYRDQLRVNDRVQFIFLQGDFDLIWQRMQNRPGHYMKPEMLRSQFTTLEPPDETEAIEISIELPVNEIMNRILQETRFL